MFQKGLYLLSSRALLKHDTVKIGMSMKLQTRMIYYKTIFNDLNSIFYVFNEKYSKSNIIDIENIILNNTILQRNYDFKTEYRFGNIHFYDSIINETLKDNDIEFYKFLYLYTNNKN